MRSKFYDAYREAVLAGPAIDGLPPAAAAPGRANDYISLGRQQQPILLLSCASSGALKRPPIRLRNLTVEFGVRFCVRAPAGIVEDDFVVVSLCGDDLGLAEAFCLTADALVTALPTVPLASDIEKAVREFVDLLSALSLPSSRAVAGLWAELWLMSVALEPQAAIMAWHRDPNNRFDFSFGSHFVEVKATELEQRNHDFSYEQLRRSEVPVRVASLRLRRAQGGKSVADLVGTLHKRLSAELRVKLVKNVFDAIGSAVSEAAEIRFDEEFAKSNLRVITADLVPTPEIPVRSPISAIRFQVNLDDSSLHTHLQELSASAALLAPPD
ncbi:PD-(D/E)XK motif protein [Silanimonas sp.]|uniref:PD-(D/E)XK motif protein n=1 Tax=Silanimonas sp. TaxID=1929290 RepID=UPI001BC0305A|nr:PD-(D/E)XK motif protein [Silanimonas sp.]MBS3896223.1 PD-(D/E)XK motif protein [Silanimonas sp.]MBS3924803.1 PD-(D/E)XK motif protein [Xanthomonadaceae bacterium]